MTDRDRSASLEVPSSSVDPEITRQLSLARWWLGVLGAIVLVIACIWLAVSGVRLLYAPGFDPLSSAMVALLLILSWVLMQRQRAALRRSLTSVSRESILDAMQSHSRFWIYQASILAAALVLTLASGVWSAVNPAMGEMWETIRAGQTAKRMQAIGEGLEAYAHEHATYPEAADVAALVRILEPLSDTKLESRDAWGHPFVYRTLCEDGLCYTYRLISPGSDGVADHAEKPFAIGGWHRSEGLSVDITKDFMYGDGHFILLPESVKVEGAAR